MRVSLGLALFALIMVAIAENARIPVDNPATHLELTMVHEAMVLEYSGRHLALIELSAVLKLLLYVSLDRLPVRALGHRAARSRMASPGDRRRRLRRQARGRRHSCWPCSRPSIAKMRVFRVSGVPWRGADARAFGNASPLRLAEPVDAPVSISTSPTCWQARWC